MMKKSRKVVKKADGGMLPSIEGRPPPDLVSLAPPLRDARMPKIVYPDELKAAQRMNERIRAGMKAPRMDRRGMAMIGPEDERMMGMDTRMRNPRIPMGIPMYAKGGKVTSKKSKAVKSSASRRADGIAKKGKTRGKFV